MVPLRIRRGLCPSLAPGREPLFEQGLHAGHASREVLDLTGEAGLDALEAVTGGMDLDKDPPHGGGEQRKPESHRSSEDADRRWPAVPLRACAREALGKDGGEARIRASGFEILRCGLHVHRGHGGTLPILVVGRMAVTAGTLSGSCGLSEIGCRAKPDVNADIVACLRADDAADGLSQRELRGGVNFGVRKNSPDPDSGIVSPIGPGLDEPGVDGYGKVGEPSESLFDVCGAERHTVSPEEDNAGSRGGQRWLPRRTTLA